jgi:hypothetical protein
MNLERQDHVKHATQGRSSIKNKEVVQNVSLECILLHLQHPVHRVGPEKYLQLGVQQPVLRARKENTKAATVFVKIARWDGTKMNHQVLIIAKYVQVGIFVTKRALCCVPDAQRARAKTPHHNLNSLTIVLNVKKNIHFPTI